MNKTLALIDAIEARLAALVAVGAVAFCAVDPHALSPKWAGIIAAAGAVAAKLAPALTPVAPAPVAPTDAQVNAELP